MRVSAVLARVLAWGGIAASHVAARKAEPKVNPSPARLQALFTALCMWLNVLDLVQVRTLVHTVPPPLSAVDAPRVALDASTAESLESDTI